MSDAKQPVDWDEIERDYRAGAMSNRELARWYGLSETAIRKRAKAHGWERPEAEATAPPEPPPQKVYVGTVLSSETTSPEAIVGRGRNLVVRLLDELDASTSRIGELEAIIEMAVDGDDPGKQREALMQAVSLKQRADVLKALATAAKTFSEAGAPAGVKQARQAAGERVAKGASKFAAPPPPATLRLVQ